MTDNYYEFKMVHNGAEIVLKCPSLVEMGYLSDRLIEFLCGCGWTRDDLKHIAAGADLYYDEPEEEETE